MTGSDGPIVGADACPDGWVTTEIENDEIDARTHRSFGDLVEMYDDAARILVDIPIGLPQTERRQCDVKARELLGCRGSSVFFPPCTAALGHTDHETASQAHKAHMDHGLSQQAYHISSKIREVNDIVGDTYSGVVRESHPELCFAALNGQPIAYPKSSNRGRGLRMRLLETMFEGAVEHYRAVREEYLLQKVRRDDILDSLVLAIAARNESLTSVPAAPHPDDPRIYYPEFSVPHIEVD